MILTYYEMYTRDFIASGVFDIIAQEWVSRMRSLDALNFYNPYQEAK